MSDGRPGNFMTSFHYVDNRLCCEGVSLKEVAERFDTPTYIYSQSAILENLSRIDAGLRSIAALVCYSVKANSNLKVLALLAKAGAGFDIVSAGELSRVRKAGGLPEQIVFSGVGKTENEIDAGLEAGIMMFNVESAGELEMIEARARHASKRASIAIRVNPDVEAQTHPYVATGRVIHKFGVPKEEAIALYRRAAGSEYLRVRGVACHIGSQILALEPFLNALEEIAGVAERLRAEQISVEFLDLGGGFGIRYEDEEPLDIERLTQELTARMNKLPYRLIVEPGRALVAEAGVLLTRVLYVKGADRKSFVVVDAGMNDLLRPALYGSYHAILPAERRSEGNLIADVVGPLCETGDFLAHDRVLPKVGPGDLVAVMTAGAYGYVLTSNYNSRPRPAEVLVHGDCAELIRRRESQEDLMAMESQP